MTAKPTEAQTGRALEYLDALLPLIPQTIHRAFYEANLPPLASLLAEERERALAEAEAVARDRGDSLARWMVKLPMHSEERKDKSLRAGESFAVADAIAALKETGRGSDGVC